MTDWWSPFWPTRCIACTRRIWPWSQDSCEVDVGWVCSYECWNGWVTDTIWGGENTDD